MCWLICYFNYCTLSKHVDDFVKFYNFTALKIILANIVWAQEDTKTKWFHNTQCIIIIESNLAFICSLLPMCNPIEFVFMTLMNFSTCVPNQWTVSCQALREWASTRNFPKHLDLNSPVWVIFLRHGSSTGSKSGFTPTKQPSTTNASCFWCRSCCSLKCSRPCPYSSWHLL